MNRMHKKHSFFIYSNMKRFKTKKPTNIKTKLVILIIIIFFIVFIFLSLKRLNSNYDNLIDLLFMENDINKEKKNKYTISSNLDYLLINYSFNEKEKKVFKEQDKSIVYLYNTHNLETYHDGKSVMDTNKELSLNLKKLGINTIVETKKTSDYLSLGLSYYNISRNFLTNNLNDNILYYIDIHRDSVTESITINNKEYAKVLFVLGLDNPNHEENKKVMQGMNTYLDNNYPGLSKGILEKKGINVDGIYNQDLSNNVILIEVGGEDSSFEEIKNATEALAIMLYHLINDKQM